MDFACETLNSLLLLLSVAFEKVLTLLLDFCTWESNFPGVDASQSRFEAVLASVVATISTSSSLIVMTSRC